MKERERERGGGGGGGGDRGIEEGENKENTKKSIIEVDRTVVDCTV